MKRLTYNRRVIKNRKADLYHSNEPIRVYSTLLEYDDKTAIRPYQKLSFRRNEQFQKSVLEGSSKITPKKKAKKQENIFGDE